HGRLDGNHVVATVMSNLGFFKALEQQGVEYDVTTVGDKYVNEDMVKHGYVLGGEQSGHIIFSKHATTGDGILTAIMLMEVMTEEKSSFSALASGMRKYPQLLKNLPVSDKDAVMNNANVLACQDTITEELRNDGRILLRPSGTEPVIRVMVEAGTDEICKTYVDRMIDAIKAEGLA
ncbi:MAG: phosphoglucosamine mutase, partial [Lachnospiraceae bacterium]|nr:phosphoglucosamine mutase [Lachnospiraceae bacterium]